VVPTLFCKHPEKVRAVFKRIGWALQSVLYVSHALYHNFLLKWTTRLSEWFLFELRNKGGWDKPLFFLFQFHVFLKELSICFRVSYTRASSSKHSRFKYIYTYMQSCLGKAFLWNPKMRLFFTTKKDAKECLPDTIAFLIIHKTWMASWERYSNWSHGMESVNVGPQMLGPFLFSLKSMKETVKA
jgi:hypothetical protein